MRQGLSESLSSPQSATKGGPVRGQIGPGQRCLVVMRQLAGQGRQQRMQPAAEQISLGETLRLWVAGIAPCGPLPLDAEQIETCRIVRKIDVLGGEAAA